MDRSVVQHCVAATVSLGLAAVVVLTGAVLDVPPLVYPALVGLGALVAAAGVTAVGIERIVFASLWPPWVIAILFDPTVALAAGLLAGAAGGLLAVPVILWVGTTTDDLATTVTDR